MKTEITTITHECDACHERCDYPYICIKCGAEYCRECSKTHGTEYQHGIYASGSGDGYYCAMCDAALTQSGGDALHRAYQVVSRLIMEHAAWGDDFERRANDAELKLKVLSAQ